MSIWQGWLFEKPFYYQTESVNARKELWDLSVIYEIVNEDVYKLKDFKKANPNAKVFLDIGANIGAFTRFVKQVYPDAKVICAEPFHQNFELLKMNAAELSNVELINKAIIGTDDDEVGFEAPALITGRNNDRNSGNGYVDRTKGPKVSATTIHPILRDLDQVDFCKIDCEGGEYEIFVSMDVDELNKLKYIVGEWHQLDGDIRLKKLLAGTHDITTRRVYSDLGFFEAKLKDLI
jgi:FkbM family methyltransferase